MFILVSCSPMQEDKPHFPVELSPPFSETGGEYAYQKVDDGWLIAIDAGEWGGAVWWYSNDGSVHYEISKDSIFQFIQMGKNVYAYGGSYRPEEGYFVSFRQDPAGHWVSMKTLDLDSVPISAERINPDLILIRTRKGVVRIDFMGRMVAHSYEIPEKVRITNR